MSVGLIATIALAPAAWWLPDASSRDGSGEARVVRWERKVGNGWSVPTSRKVATRWANRRAKHGRVGIVRARKLSLIWGEASWYGEAFRGRTTFCGQSFDPDKLTTAHRTLPCGTKLWVKGNGRKVKVTVTDRGPFADGRILDLSRAAFARLASTSRGTLHVHAYVVRGGG